MSEFNTGDIIIWGDPKTKPTGIFSAMREYYVTYHENGHYIADNTYYTHDLDGYVLKEEYIKDNYDVSTGDIVFCVDLNKFTNIYNLWVEGHMLRIEVVKSKIETYYTDFNGILTMSEYRSRKIDDILK